MSKSNKLSILNIRRGLLGPALMWPNFVGGTVPQKENEIFASGPRLCYRSEYHNLQFKWCSTHKSDNSSAYEYSYKYNNSTASFNNN